MDVLFICSSSGTYDAEGVGSATIELTNAATLADINIESVTVGLVDSTDNVSTFNVLSKKSVDNMALSMISASANASLSVDGIIQKMPLHKYFPQAKKGVASFVSGFALQSNAVAARENVLANLSWLKHEPKYAVLHDEVETLQTYFGDTNHPNLAHFSAEFMQEATMQASNGNNFWLRAMATSYKVWAEMASSNPVQADLIASAIENRTDFLAWVRILSIPANGWATESIPVPRPDITCDKVSPTVNVGTPLAYSGKACRASGAQMAALVQTLNEVDPRSLTEPALLTMYMTHMLESVKYMPLEYKKWFSGGNNNYAWNVNSHLAPEAHAVIPAIVGYAFRAMAIALKQTIRAASGAAPANFVAFLQEGTNSRIDAKELLPAIVYLSSRYSDAPDELCNGCEPLNDQVTKVIKSDIATWFVGMGLARQGKITDGDLKEKQCTLGFNTHGKAFEIHGTAMYHALYEFGSSFGLETSAEYKILLSDPSGEETIKVGLMHKVKGSDKPTLYREALQRKPDLVLQGGGEGKRTWIEFKSWKYNKNTVRPLYLDGDELDDKTFLFWNGKSTTKEATWTANANRQHFLDFAASSAALNDDYWAGEGKDYNDWKPSKHHTQMQIWLDGEKGKRSWRALIKDKNGKYALADKKDPLADKKDLSTLNRAGSWIGSKELGAGGLVTNVPIQFQALQRFIAGVSKQLDTNMYKTSLGYDKTKHDEDYRDKQVKTNFAGLLESNIRPFNTTTFIALELGNQSKTALADFKNKMLEAVGDGDFAKLKDAIEREEISLAQVEKMRELVSDEINTLLGPVQHLLFEIPLWSDFENYAADKLIGAELEKEMQSWAQIDLPEDYFANSCEK